MEHVSDVYTDCDLCSEYSQRGIIIGKEGRGKSRTSGDHPNYYTIEIGQNTKKSPGDLRRLVVTQTKVKTYLLALM